MNNRRAASHHDPAGLMGLLYTAQRPRLPHAAWLCVIAMAASMVAGCAAVGPKYAPPQVSVPAAWQAAFHAGVTAEASDPQTLAQWWTTLNDADLASLMARAIAGNLDFKQAQARLREARARRRISQADYFPTLEASGAASTSRSSEAAGKSQQRELYSVGFDASWELDVFGRVRRSVAAAQADVEASQEEARDVLVSLLAEVALNVVEVRTFQERLVVAEANLAAQQETQQLTGWRFTAGLTSALDVEQATFNLESTRSQIPPLRTGIEQAMNRLAVLLGAASGAVNTPLSRRRPIPVAPLSLAVGVPAEVLRRRPDIRRAERQLAAQTARVGVATADLYPRFALLGSIGLEALAPDKLFAFGSLLNSLAGQITRPLFKAGAIRANIAVQNALQEQALFQYEAAILAAIEEVENALVAYAQEQQRRQALFEATQAAQRAVELARNQYASGLSDFQNVLEGQRSLLSFQDQLAQSTGAVTLVVIRLYKALGGGWAPLGEHTPPPVSRLSPHGE